MRIRATAILFDSDGVLVDSHRQVDECWHRLAAEFGLDFDQMGREMVGVRAIDTLSRYVAPDRLGAAIDRLEELEVESAASTDPVPGALELLTSLPAGTWSIVTSATRRLGVARWRGAGIPIPDRVVTADQVTAGKPDPEPFLAGASLLGVEPADCLVFEDSRPGGVAAAKAGSPVIAVGHQPWDVDPVARIDDLMAVRLVGVDGDGLDLEVTATAHVL
jgi:sugar-phosphatase